MKDIFDAKIMCEKCNVKMEKVNLEKAGFILRAVQCPHCRERIVHPGDLNNFNQYNDLRGKTFSVKLRMVGNSHAISIPKEIVDFINEMNYKMSRHMNDVVKLCFEDFGKLSLNFIDEDLKKNAEKSERRNLDV